MRFDFNRDGSLKNQIYGDNMHSGFKVPVYKIGGFLFTNQHDHLAGKQTFLGIISGRRQTAGFGSDSCRLTSKDHHCTDYQSLLQWS
jgi:hypothetical protein